MQRHFYYDKYNGLSEWVCENIGISLEFRPVFQFLIFLAVAYTMTRLDDEWGRFSIVFFYLFNPFFMGQLRKERFDDTDKLTVQTPIVSKQTQPYDLDGFVSYAYEIYFEHPNDKQIICISVDCPLYDNLAVGDKLSVDYSPRYLRQCDVFIHT